MFLDLFEIPKLYRAVVKLNADEQNRNIILYSKDSVNYYYSGVNGKLEVLYGNDSLKLFDNDCIISLDECGYIIDCTFFSINSMTSVIKTTFKTANLFGNKHGVDYYGYEFDGYEFSIIKNDDVFTKITHEEFINELIGNSDQCYWSSHTNNRKMIQTPYVNIISKMFYYITENGIGNIKETMDDIDNTYAITFTERCTYFHKGLDHSDSEFSRELVVGIYFSRAFGMNPDSSESEVEHLLNHYNFMIVGDIGNIEHIVGLTYGDYTANGEVMFANLSESSETLALLSGDCKVIPTSEILRLWRKFYKEGNNVRNYKTND